MKRFYSNVGSLQAALQQRPEVLHAVDVNLSAHVSLGLVNDVMYETALQSVVVSDRIIGVNRAAILHSLENLILQSLSAHVRNDGSADLSQVAVEYALHNRLVLVRAFAFQLGAFALVHVLGDAANESLINFHFAALAANLA